MFRFGFAQLATFLEDGSIYFVVSIAQTASDAGQEEVCAPCTIPLTRTTSLKTEHDDKHWVGKSDSKPAVGSAESDASVESDWAETRRAVAARVVARSAKP